DGPDGNAAQPNVCLWPGCALGTQASRVAKSVFRRSSPFQNDDLPCCNHRASARTGDLRTISSNEWPPPLTQGRRSSQALGTTKKSVNERVWEARHAQDRTPHACGWCRYARTAGRCARVEPGQGPQVRAERQPDDPRSDLDDGLRHPRPRLHDLHTLFSTDEKNEVKPQMV